MRRREARSQLVEPTDVPSEPASVHSRSTVQAPSSSTFNNTIPLTMFSTFVRMLSLLGNVTDRVSLCCWNKLSGKVIDDSDSLEGLPPFCAGSADAFLERQAIVIRLGSPRDMKTSKKIIPRQTMHQTIIMPQHFTFRGSSDFIRCSGMP